MNKSTLSIASNFKYGNEFNPITTFCLSDRCQKNALMCIDCIDDHVQCQVFSFKQIDNLFKTHEQNYQSKRQLFTKLKNDIIAKLEDDEKLLFQCLEKFYKIDKIKNLVQWYDKYQNSLNEQDLVAFLNIAKENIVQDGQNLQFKPLQTNIINLFAEQMKLMKTRIDNINSLIKDSTIEYQEIQVMKNMNTESFFNPPINPKELRLGDRAQFEFESISPKPFKLIGVKSNRIISSAKAYTIKFEFYDKIPFKRLKEQTIDRVNTDLDAFVIDVNKKIEPNKSYLFWVENMTDCVLQLPFFQDPQDNGFIRVKERSNGQFPIFLIDILNKK
ncbi:hypothetical protein pb186bvf_019411 [Paramecium bursaria]